MAEGTAATAVTAATTTTTPTTARVPRGLLLWLYAVVPVGVVVPAVDGWLLDGTLRAMLPRAPDELAWWTVVFNVPHIVASHLLLLDGEYLRFYRRWLLIGLALVGVWLFLTFRVLDPIAVLWLNAAITMYHVLGQQVGITRLMGGGDPGRVLLAWRVLAVVVFLLALAESFRGPVAAAPSTGVWLGALLCIPMTACAARAYSAVQGRRPRLYVLANQVMFLSFLPLAVTGYGFFLALMPRVVHDLSAFAFYIGHDLNRNRDAPRGLLYRALGFTGLPPWLLLPAVSIGIGYVLTRIDSAELLYPVGALSLLHYIMEGVTWRRSGLHRKSIALA